VIVVLEEVLTVAVSLTTLPEAEFFEIVNAVRTAFAGAIAVKVPNASEATATADTFFNEIVFTITLSFSRFQAFPGLGCGQKDRLISNERLYW
jgi:hypothetical protein